MRLAIVGSTNWTAAGETMARSFIRTSLARLQPEVVISGGAEGVDSWAAAIARSMGIEVIEHLPKNQRWAPEGFQDRNLLIAEDCTGLVVIRSSISTTYGSGWTADRAEAMGRPVIRRMF